MKRKYLIEVIEPNKKLELEISPFLKQKCNFYIEVLQIRINYGKKRKKEKNKSFLHYGA